MATHFLSIPTEILVHIFCKLDPYTILSCSLTHSSLHRVIEDHQIIQYHTAKDLAGVVDNPYRAPSFPVADRLASLRSREEGWGRLKIDFRETVPVKHDPSGIYDVGGGIYLMGNKDRKTLHYLALPSKEKGSGDEPTQWRKIEVEKRLIDMALGIWENDLIAVVTTSPSATNYGMHVIEIVLLEFSTRKPHPLAKNPVLRVYESPWPFPSIGMEIVGDNIALVLTHHLNRFHPDDSFYVFDWKSGTMKMGLSIAFHTYAGLVFLSPSILLLPNMRRNTLDFWTIPDSPETALMRPIRSLSLPTLGPMFFNMVISCRGEPNPVGATPTDPNTKGGVDSGFPYSREPYHARSEDAIVIFNMRVQRLVGVMDGYAFSFFAHRRSLLELCPSVPDLSVPRDFDEEDAMEEALENFGEEDEDEDEDEDDEDNEDEMDDEDGEAMTGIPILGNGWGSDEDEVVQIVASTSMSTGAPNTAPNSASTPSQASTSTPATTASTPTSTAPTPGPATPAPTPITTNPDSNAWPAPIPWDTWGPSTTRWFDTDDVPTRWITTSAGQRCVVYSEGDPGRDAKPALTVFDFNPVNVHKVLRRERERAKEPRFIDDSERWRRGEGEGRMPGTWGDDREGAAGREQAEEEDDEYETAFVRAIVSTSEIRGEMFESPVRSSLPFTSYTVVDFPLFDGVLMDEERLLGLKANDNNDGIIEVEIMHIGSGGKTKNKEKGKARLLNI